MPKGKLGPKSVPSPHPEKLLTDHPLGSSQSSVGSPLEKGTPEHEWEG